MDNPIFCSVVARSDGLGIRSSMGASITCFSNFALSWLPNPSFKRDRREAAAP